MHGAHAVSGEFHPHGNTAFGQGGFSPSKRWTMLQYSVIWTLSYVQICTTQVPKLRPAMVIGVMELLVPKDNFLIGRPSHLGNYRHYLYDQV